jgi:hypothetical protein
MLGMVDRWHSYFGLHNAEMDKDPLSRLRAIVDLLGPNMWLHLDQVSFPWFFDKSIDVGVDARSAIEAATAFAQEHGCTFIFDDQTRVGRFGRAYFKKETDARST